MRPTPDTLKLPPNLVKELGISGVPSRQDRIQNTFTNRKAKRKAERLEWRIVRNGLPPFKRKKKLQHSDAYRTTQTPCRQEPPPMRSPEVSKIDRVKPKSTTERRDSKDVTKGDIKLLSPPENLPQSVAEKLAQDDAEILALERKLGLRGRKGLPQAFKDDGLDKLLDGLCEYSDSSIQDGMRKGSDESDWFARKRMQARNSSISENRVNEGTSSREKNIRAVEPFLSLSGSTHPNGDGSIIREGEDKALSDPEDDFTSPGSQVAVMPLSPPTTRARENPYVAPLANDRIPTTYIPPSLRSASSSELEDLATLRRQVQGLANRLTESNLISIIGNIENLYQNNARSHVTSTIVDIILASVCGRTSLPDTLMILWAGFTTAIYKIIGADFGAQFIQKAVALFDEHYVRAEESGDPSAATLAESGKEASNLIALLAELYNFQLVGSNLIFDYIRWFLDKLSELNVELLLKIIRTSGPLLRQEDPSSLKGIVDILSPIITKREEENVTVRTKFMIEMINDLKNNRVKTGISTSIVTSEHITQMKKILGTLNTRNVKASEPLRMGLRDIRESDKKGKWWLVGASWVGNEARRNEYNKESPGTTPSDTCSRITNLDEAEASNLAGLAREQRMNTDIRQAIFITVMSATDYQDAYLRLMKLKLKKAQELEIPKILIHCLSSENAYNPYYTLIAKKLCGDRKLKVAFRFSLWDIFKKLGEGDDEDAAEGGDSGSALDMRQLVNLAKMFGSLIADGSLTLVVLKCLRFRYLQSKTKAFVEVLLITVLLQSQAHVGNRRDKNSVANIILSIRDAPQVAEGLKHFMRKVVGKTDITSCEAEKATIRWACKIAVGALEGIIARNTSGT